MADSTDHAQAALPPPLIFLGYLVGALMLNWAVPFAMPWTTAFRIVGGLAVVGGLWLGGSAISQMREAHTTPDPRQPATALVTTGPYRFTRNPIYLGFFLIYLGFTLLAGTLWGLLLSPFLLGTVTQSIIHAEETYLKRKFEEEYTVFFARAAVAVSEFFLQEFLLRFFVSIHILNGKNTRKNEYGRVFFPTVFVFSELFFPVL